MKPGSFAGFISEDKCGDERRKEEKVKMEKVMTVDLVLISSVGSWVGERERERESLGPGAWPTIVSQIILHRPILYVWQHLIRGSFSSDHYVFNLSFWTQGDRR